MTKKLKQKKLETRVLRDDLNQSAPLEDENGNPTTLGQEIQSLELETVGEYQAALDEAQHKVQSIVDDPNAIKQYESTLAEIEQVEAQLEQMQDSKDSLGRKIQQELDSWKTRLATSIEQINKLFIH